MSITDFLLARIAEDEAAARAVMDSKVKPDGKGLWSVQIGVTGNGAQFAHVGVDPARVLAECAAKRAIVAECLNVQADPWDYADAIYTAEVAVYALAAVYADHPAYLDKWRVGA